MKILLFSDLHLHTWPYGSTVVDGINSRLKAQADVLAKIAEASEEADHVVFCGDLFHTHGNIHASVLKVAYEGMYKIINQSNVWMDILVGNHDTSDKTMQTHNLHWLNAFNDMTSNPPLRVVDRPIHNSVEEPDWVDNYSFLPYTEDKAVIEKFFAECGELVFMHQGVANVPMGSGFLIDEILTEDMIPDHVEHVFTGHYHQHNRVSNRLTVVGSTMQHTWNDEGDDRGWVWYDTDTKEVELVDSGAPRFVTYDMVNALRPNRKNPVDVENNFVRVTGYEDRFKEDIRKELTEAGARSVEFVTAKVDAKRLQTPSTAEGFHLPSLVADYEKQKEVTDERSKVGREIMG